MQMNVGAYWRRVNEVIEQLRRAGYDERSVILVSTPQPENGVPGNVLVEASISLAGQLIAKGTHAIPTDVREARRRFEEEARAEGERVAKENDKRAMAQHGRMVFMVNPEAQTATPVAPAKHGKGEKE